MPPPSISTFQLNAGTANNFCYIVASDCDRVELWRQHSGEEARRLTKTYNPAITPIFIYDFNCIKDVLTQYWAKAVDDDTGVEATSATLSTTQTELAGAYLHKVVRAASTTKSGTLIQLNNQEGAQREIQIAADILHLPANDKPIIEVSQTVQRIWRIPVLLNNLSNGTRELLNGFIENHDVLCCRDERGRRMFGVMQRVKERLDLTGDYPFELHECDYREHVA